MNRLLLSEVYKLSTTKVWWALLIPVAVIAFVLGLAGAAIAGLSTVVEDAGLTPALALTMPISMEQTTVFAAVVGLIGGAGEFRHRTITTTYLTGVSRGSVLAAKAIVHAGLGLVYGVVTAVFCAAGALLNSGTDSFPSTTDTLAVAAAGVVGVMAWCVLGVGIGVLITNQIAVLIVVLVYLLFVEGLIGLLVGTVLGADELPRYLPGAGSTALQTAHGITVFANAFGDEAFGVHDVVEGLVGSSGQLSWWGGGLLIAAYTAAFLAAGWYVGGRRDIT